MEAHHMELEPVQMELADDSHAYLFFLVVAPENCLLTTLPRNL